MNKHDWFSLALDEVGKPHSVEDEVMTAQGDGALSRTHIPRARRDGDEHNQAKSRPSHFPGPVILCVGTSFSSNDGSEYCAQDVEFPIDHDRFHQADGEFTTASPVSSRPG